MAFNFMLYAPNVHTGGGLVLLREILSAWPVDVTLNAFLDVRAKGALLVPNGSVVFWVTPKLASRIRAEINLKKMASVGGVVLCFHNLPPLLVTQSKILVYLQNMNLISTKRFPTERPWVRFRYHVERFILRILRRRVTEYWVQTPSMRRELMKWYGHQEGGRGPRIRLMPFVKTLGSIDQNACELEKIDFIYVADGVAHKNHKNLLAAWKILAEEGIKPSLILTLSQRDIALANEIEVESRGSGANIRNYGQVSHDKILQYYSCAKALVFPSLSESFGLPLIEAKLMNLPIIASEMDYVRDVCEPVETFDPSSPVSISRAIKRFLGVAEELPRTYTPAEFIDGLLEGY